MKDQNADRLRQHPDQRFASPQQQFDLAATAAALRQEAQAGEGGHRQQCLYKNGRTSISLFLFDRLTRLAAHRTKGIATIHVLKGHLRVNADGESHDLSAGRLLVLASGILHDVVAQEESEMLLAVHLDGNENGPS